MNESKNFILIIILLISLFNLTTFAIDCSLVRCAQPKCPVGKHLVIPEGSCCGECQSCEGVPCNRMIKYCGPNEEPTGCCPCVKNPQDNPILDCSLVACPAIYRICGPNEKPVGCCPCFLG